MSDRKCTISVSKDGAHDFVAHTEHSLGEVGEFGKRVTRRKLGQARHMVVCIEVSSNMKSDLLSASIDMETER